MNADTLNIEEERPVSNSKTQRRYHDNGKLKIEIQVTNGKPDGILKSYYENGELEFKSTYSNGKEHGIAQGYYKNGKLKFIGTSIPITYPVATANIEYPAKSKNKFKP